MRQGNNRRLAMQSSIASKSEIRFSSKDTKTVQGLLRHANVSTTLGLYAQSVNSSMVDAQESMLKAILRSDSKAVN